MKSEQINELAKALTLAQSQMPPAKKSGHNPHFNSRFPTLEDAWEACRLPLTKNTLSVSQSVEIGEGGRYVLRSILLHASGQWIESVYPLDPVKRDPQGLGSCVSYARRYSLMALVGIAAEDDDGNKASEKVFPSSNTVPVIASAPKNQTKLKGARKNADGEQSPPSPTRFPREAEGTQITDVSVAPVCCGQNMMPSKWPKGDQDYWWCTKCRAKADKYDGMPGDGGPEDRELENF